MRLVVLFVWCSLIVLNCTSQTFSDVATMLGIQVNVYDNLHGAGVSFVDFDNDGDDDLTFCEDNVIKVYRNDNGIATLVDLGLNVIDNAKHPVWIDFDNDEDLDFFVTQMQGPNLLYEQISPGVFENITAGSGLSMYDDPSFGCSWGDYDRDGDLDVYICNYVYIAQGPNQFTYSNHLFENLGQGQFQDVTLQAGVSDGISLSFQSIWSDFDLDGWPDLYVINDLEHPNRLYHNQGDGTFSDISASSLSAVPMMDAMSATCGDFNKDGYEDIFISNVAIQASALLTNNGDLTFTNLAAVTDTELWQLCWGASWLDYDLDADLDLFVCENNYTMPNQSNFLFKNNGYYEFEQLGSDVLLFDDANSYSSAVGDWNGDFWPDIAVNNWEDCNANLWENSGTTSHFVAIELKGTVSNKFGIGARLDCWSNELHQAKQLYCGEGYLSQNSHRVVFGLASSGDVDSLSINWPSGHVDRIYDLELDQLQTVVEGQSWDPSLIFPTNYTMCSGDSTLVVVPEGIELMASEDWIEGPIYISAGETIAVEIANEFGIVTELILLGELSPVADFELVVTDALCFDGSDGTCEFVGDPAEFLSVVWSNGDTGFEADSLAQGSVLALIITAYGCEIISEQWVEAPDQISGSIEVSDATCWGFSDGIIDLQLQGGNPPFIQVLGPDLAAVSAGMHELSFVDQGGCEWSQAVFVNEPDSISFLAEVNCESGLAIDLSPFGGTPPFEFEWSNGLITEDVLDMESICLNVNILDANACLFQSPAICCPVSIIDFENLFSIAPNPVVDELLITGQGMLAIELLNTQGQIVIVKEGLGSIELDMRSFSSGSYILKVRNSWGAEFVQKVVKF